MESSSQSWSVIIFCYNEEKTVASVILSAHDFFSKSKVHDFEIIIVDDGSSDNSVAEIKKIQEQFSTNTPAIFHGENKGIGAALRTGYLAAKNENICAIPADAQFDVAEFGPHLFIPEKTFISFYRKENVQYTTFRNILSYVNRKMNHYFIGIQLKDVNWIKIYKSKEIRKFEWKISSSLIESEICLKLLFNGNKVIEEVSVYYPRKHGESKGASLKIVLQAMKEIMKLILVLFAYKRNFRSSTPLDVDYR